MRTLNRFVAAFAFTAWGVTQAQVTQTVVDIPSRPGVTQRVLFMSPPEPRAALILFAGGHGGLQMAADGSLQWGQGHFLVRNRQMFAEAGFAVAVIDAPSDKQVSPFLHGHRQKPEHTADIKAVVSWSRDRVKKPVWLVGTSRGTQSVAYLANTLTGDDAPDGIVLTATILKDDKGRSVPAMPVDRIKVPVLVVHHEDDACDYCSFELVPELMRKMTGTPKTGLLTFKGGKNVGDPCEPLSHHGFNGIDREVVAQTARWILGQ